ncbi:DUF4402 domain-containing protein [Erythrobacter sp. NAP1]|uniref:DUF4402 domain-containing protein n=1 Tax=Erythrobacter sp. NAP1 TaxID=237727 RepID=UPI00030AE0A5|nr:DUF4402 domain-containing protein [Erythrobacter sp. NAP1]
MTLAAASLAVPALIGADAPVRAQGNCPNCDLPPGCRGNGNQRPPPGNGNGNRNRNCQRITITIESDIDFGRVVLLGSGEARVLLDLESGRKTVIGDVDDLGGMPITGRAMIQGAPFEEVVISIPNEIGMRDPNGGTARVREFVTDLDGFPRLDSDGQLEFRFSGTLVIEAETDASGNLRGRVPITVEYP